MPLKSRVVLGVALSLAVAAAAIAQDTPAIVVDPAIATMTDDQLVQARQDAMKENGMVLRGAGRLSGAEAVAAATIILQNFTDFPSLFREGSTGGGSKALPSVWQNWDDFKARFDHDAGVATRMLVAAQTGDAAGYTAAVREIGENCGACHMTYRGR